MKIFAERLIELRKERGLTQKELAEKTGVSEKAVSKWETGRGFPDTGLILPLAEALQVSVNELLSGQKLDDKNFAAKAEENFSVLLKDKVSAKTKSAAAWLSFAAVLFSALILIVVCAGIAEMHVWVRVALIIAAFLSLFSFTVLVCVQGASNEIFECPLCGEKFSVSHSQTILPAENKKRSAFKKFIRENIRVLIPKSKALTL